MKKLIVLLVLFLSACGSGSTGSDPEPVVVIPDVVSVDPDAIVSITVLEKWPDSEDDIFQLELVTANKSVKVWHSEVQDEIKIGDKLIEQPEGEHVTGVYVNDVLVDFITDEEGEL